MSEASRRAIVALRESLPRFEAEAKERQRTGRRGTRGAKQLGRAASAAGTVHGVGARTIERAKRVVEARPDLARRVLEGELTVKRAETIMRLGAAGPIAERVYFIQANADLIKIGRASSPHDRLESFQIGCPLELRLLGSYAPGDAVQAEAELHRRFAKARHRGEWFRPTTLLLAFIEEIKRGQD
jgi:hypothetical protein